MTARQSNRSATENSAYLLAFFTVRPRGAIALPEVRHLTWRAAKRGRRHAPVFRQGSLRTRALREKRADYREE
jgi:hypothetical protein